MLGTLGSYINSYLFYSEVLKMIQNCTKKGGSFKPLLNTISMEMVEINVRFFFVSLNYKAITVTYSLFSDSLN